MKTRWFASTTAPSVTEYEVLKEGETWFELRKIGDTSPRGLTVDKGMDFDTRAQAVESLKTEIGKTLTYYQGVVKELEERLDKVNALP